MECPDCGHDMIGPHMFGEYLCARCGYMMQEETEDSKENTSGNSR